MKKFFLIIIVALLVLSPTMAQQRKTTPQKPTTATKSSKTPQKRTAAVTTSNYTARGELGLFDLRGPVKECVWTTKDQTRKLGFDKKGMWISEDGKEPWSNYDSVKRDNKGRIVLMGNEIESGKQFTYNANGLMTKHVTIYMDGRDIATYTYNSKGECTKETFSYDDMYGSGKNTAIFTILSRDEQGNWTKRKTQKGNVETRTITYYEFSKPYYLTNPPQLVSQTDSLSYAIGMAQTEGLLPYLKNELKINLNYIDDFIHGLTGQIAVGSFDEQNKAYEAGCQISNQISSKMVPGINKLVYGDESEGKTISMNHFMAGFVNGITGKNDYMTLNQAQIVAERLIGTLKKEEMMKTYGENKIASEQFMSSNATKAGIKILSSGVQYKIVKQGTGAIPTINQKVEVHYKGNTIDGKEFDNSYKRGKPVEFECNQVIQGWIDALTHMPVGSIWEVYIPQHLAYGERQYKDIKPFSALIFTIELLRIIE